MNSINCFIKPNGVFGKSIPYEKFPESLYWFYLDTQGIFDLYRVVKCSSGIIALRRSPIFSIQFRSKVVRTKP